MPSSAALCRGTRIELEASPRHRIVTPSSVAVLSGLGGSGGMVCWSVCGALSWCGVLLGELYGVSPLCLVPNLAPLPGLLVHLDGCLSAGDVLGSVVDPPSTSVTVLCSSGTCLVPVSTLDSFLSLLSTLNLPLSG